MFSSDLIDIVATYGVAIVALGALWHIGWLFQDDYLHLQTLSELKLLRPVLRIFSGRPTSNPLSFSVMACIMVFAFGQIVQDLTDHLVDSVHIVSYEKWF